MVGNVVAGGIVGVLIDGNNGSTHDLLRNPLKIALKALPVTTPPVAATSTDAAAPAITPVVATASTSTTPATPAPAVTPAAPASTIKIVATPAAATPATATVPVVKK